MGHTSNHVQTKLCLQRAWLGFSSLRCFALCMSGVLLVVDVKQNQMWTAVGPTKIRRPLNSGLIGYSAQRAESILSVNVARDPRYDPVVDDVVLSVDVLRSASHLQPREGPTVRRGSEENTSLLLVPLCSSSGTVLGVLSATVSRFSTNTPFFAPDDVGLMMYLSTHIARVMEALEIAGAAMRNSHYRHQSEEGGPGSMQALVKTFNQKTTEMESKATSLVDSSRMLNEQLMAMSRFAGDTDGIGTAKAPGPSDPAAHRTVLWPRREDVPPAAQQFSDSYVTPLSRREGKATTRFTATLHSHHRHGHSGW